MTLRLATCFWLLPLIVPFQAGRWYLRHGRPGTGLGLFGAVFIAVAALVTVNLIRSP